MSQFRFNEDFANNWESGQIVICEEKENGYLVDKVALIEKDELLKHGEFITMNVEILGHMQSNGVDDLFSCMIEIFNQETQYNISKVVSIRLLPLELIQKQKKRWLYIRA